MAKSLSTKTKLQKLKVYLLKHHTKLMAIDPRNITGVGIGKKRRGGREYRNYSIVFHVLEKREERSMAKGQTILKYLKVPIGKGQSIRIKTDVIVTGPFKFHAGVGALVYHQGANKGGSVGLYLTDQFQNVFGLTNYHVLGQNLMANNVYHYQTNDLMRLDAFVVNMGVNFYCGFLDGENDSALVYLSQQALQALGGPSNAVNGHSIGNQPANFYAVGDQVAVFGRLDYNKGSLINQIGVSKLDNDTQLTMSGLISFNRVTQPGDSGCLLVLFGASTMPLGLVIGADGAGNSYAIPLTTIIPSLNNTFHLSLTII